MNHFLKLYNSQAVALYDDTANFAIDFYAMEIVRFKGSKQSCYWPRLTSDEGQR